MKHSSLLINCFLFVVLIGFSSCSLFKEWSIGDTDVRVDNITTLAGADIPHIDGNSTYSFIIITDTHFGSSHSLDQEQVINAFKNHFSDSTPPSKRARFIVNLGDTMDGGQTSQAMEYNEFCEKLREAARQEGLSDLKIYNIPGNHDLYFAGWDNWKENIWPYCSFYRFTISSFTYYFLDTAYATLGKKQFNNFKAAIEKDTTNKIILTHYPVFAGSNIWTDLQNPMERNMLLYTFAANKVKAAFYGHDHGYNEQIYDAFTEKKLPSLRYRSQYTLVTVNEETGSVTSEICSF